MSFGAYQPEDQVLSSDAIVSPMWSNDLTQLSTFYSWSAQEIDTAQGKFFLNVFQGDVSVTQSLDSQFTIAYGHISGSGSSYFNALVPDKTPTRDVYGQFRSLIYGDENSSFQFGGTAYTSKDIIVISVNRARYKESFNPGSFYLTIKSGSNQISLVDDSTVTTVSTYIGTTRVYQLLSGSYSGNTQTTVPSSSNYTVSGSYGIMLPDEGLVILNPRALALSSGPLGGVGAIFNEFSSSQVASYFTALGETYNLNNRMVFDMIDTATNPTFSLQSYETISSRYFFTRVKNAESNYTTNPTVIDSNGNLLYTQLIYNPQTYITTVGLYNNSGDLLAVAKLNKPLVKDFTKELLLRVKLDF
jgi:hypothetical protein